MIVMFVNELALLATLFARPEIPESLMFLVEIDVRSVVLELDL